MGGKAFPATGGVIMTVRILSIDGGGVRGILPARVLQTFEDILNHPVSTSFDLIAGTSTGGIIACGLLAGLSARSLGDLYAQNGGRIFDHSLWRSITTLDNLDGPKYPANVLESILRDRLGDKWLSDVAGTQTAGPEMLIPAYCLRLPAPVLLDGSNIRTSRCPYFFKSWKAAGRCLDPSEQAAQHDFPLWQIARATSAAPTYFPPAGITNRIGQRFAMVDGGVFANNPALCAVASAQKIFKDEDFLVVSLGTGSLERAIDADAAMGWGEVRWLHPILSILMDGNADTVCYELDQIPSVRHFRFEISTGTDFQDPACVNEDFDDAHPDNIARLETLAQRLIADQRPKILDVIKRLEFTAPATRR